MDNAVKLEVWGDYASFNRPEMKVERVSYEVMTPSAARGILEAIYWKPQMRWVVDAIHVLRPIRLTSLRRNEIAVKISTQLVERAMKGGAGDLGIDVGNPRIRAQRAAIILRDVRYGIEAHVEVLEPDRTPGSGNGNSLAKHLEMFRRRASRGQCFHHPYLGTREFPAEWALVESFGACPEELRGERDLGLMLHDILFEPDPKGKVVESHRGIRCSATPRFFLARMLDGVIGVPPLVGSPGGPS